MTPSNSSGVIKGDKQVQASQIKFAPAFSSLFTIPEFEAF